MSPPHPESCFFFSFGSRRVETVQSVGALRFGVVEIEKVTSQQIGLCLCKRLRGTSVKPLVWVSEDLRSPDATRFPASAKGGGGLG